MGTKLGFASAERLPYAPRRAPGIDQQPILVLVRLELMGVSADEDVVHASLLRGERVEVTPRDDLVAVDERRC